MTAMLRHPRFWQAVGLVWVAAVIYACLIPSEPGLGIPGIDKVMHCTAFAGLAGWFGAVTGRRRHLLIGAGLVVLGALIEILQGYTGRDPSVWDWVADSVGVGIGLALSKSVGLPIVRYIEGRASALRHRYL